MKIYYTSDVHLEAWRGHPPVFESWPGDADVTVMAGDIGSGTQGIDWAASQASRYRQAIIYVPGNHEFYGHDLPAMRGELQQHARNRPGVILLDDSVAVIEGVRFIGSTLWTDYVGEADVPACNMARAMVGLTDHYRIRNGSRLFTPADALALHQAARHFLKTELAKSFSGPTVVVTHHCPSMRCSNPHFGNDSLATAFCSNLDGVIRQYQPSVWICGHTHAPVDFMVGQTRIVNRPVGYPGELVYQDDASPPATIII